MTPDWIILLIPFLWLINGMLILCYVLVEHWPATLLLPLIGVLSHTGPDETHRWGLAIAALGLLSALAAPQPAPLFLLLMAAAALLGVRLEQFNPAGLHWRALGGLGLYALLGLAAALLVRYLESAASASELLSQGENYLGVIISLALYLFPAGYLGLLAQSLLVHPPIPGSGRPDQLITSLRSRNED